MAIDPSKVRRYAHGSRVPGWDEAADLTKDPAVVPDPATTPVPAEIRAEIEAQMAKYPDIRSAAIPALKVVAAGARLVLADGDRAGRLRDAAHPRVPDRGGDVLRHVRHRARRPPPGLRVHEHLLLAARRRRDLPGDAVRRRRRPALQRAVLRVPGRMRHRADGVRRRRVRRPAHRGGLPDGGRRRRSRAARRWRPSSCASARRRSTTGRRRPERGGPLQGSGRAGPQHARGLRAPRRLRDAPQGAEDGAAGRARRDADVERARARRRRLRDGQEDVLHPEGDDGQVPRLQRRRVRARHVQGPRADAEEPASADRGDDHRRLRDRRQPLLHLHPRRVRAPGRRAGRRARRGARRRVRRRAHPRLRPHAGPRRPPRRRRLHLRRGDGAAGRAGGQARQPAPEAPVPRHPGPLPGPDADQQRRDADERPVRAADRRRGVREGRHRDARRAPRSSRSRAASSARATTRSSSGSPRARSSSTSRAARPRDARSRPGSPAARALRC